MADGVKTTGRPRLRLADLVRERRFDWSNHRHRRALFDAAEDEVSDHPNAEDLALYAARQRVCETTGQRGLASTLAQAFESIVRDEDPEEDAW